MSKWERKKYLCVNDGCPVKGDVIMRLKIEGKKVSCELCGIELAEDVQALTPTGKFHIQVDIVLTKEH